MNHSQIIGLIEKELGRINDLIEKHTSLLAEASANFEFRRASMLNEMCIGLREGRCSLELLLMQIKNSPSIGGNTEHLAVERELTHNRK